MKKFSPERELKKVRGKTFNGNSSRLNNLYVPLLVIACSCLAIEAVTFSAKLVEETKDKYTVRVDIVNGEQDVFLKNVTEGAFRATILGKNTFHSIECSDGELNYDVATGEVYSKHIRQNTRCTLVFEGDSVKEVNDPEGMNGIYDNSGRSYYYKADSVNNYVRIKDMMFRIVRVNGDGTYRLILNDNNLESSYGSSNDYYESTLKTTLENWFQTHFSGESYLVQKDYDVFNYIQYETDSLVNIEGYHSNFVGTLSVIEASLVLDGVSGSTYLDSDKGILLANGNGIDNVFCYRNGGVVGVVPSENLIVKPVINVGAEFVGEGTLENPYMIPES